MEENMRVEKSCISISLDDEYNDKMILIVVEVAEVKGSSTHAENFAQTPD